MPFTLVLTPYAEVDVASIRGNDGYFSLIAIRGNDILDEIEKDVELHAPGEDLKLEQILAEINLVTDRGVLMAGGQAYIYFRRHLDPAFWYATIEEVREI